MTVFEHDTWRYNPAPRLFMAGEELPEGDWRDSPAKFAEDAPTVDGAATPDEAEDKAAVVAQLDALQVQFDRRLGLKRLKALLAEAQA